jgi:hypothetical protein
MVSAVCSEQGGKEYSRERILVHIFLPSACTAPFCLRASSLAHSSSAQHLALVPSRRSIFHTYFAEPLCLLVGVPYTVNLFWCFFFILFFY